MNQRPDASEYAPFYAGYIALVGGNDIINTLEQEGRQSIAFLSSLHEDQGALRYAPGKWTIKEVIGHVIDTERIQAYRALRIARNDKTNLPGFEQDDYVPFSNSGNRTVADLIKEFACVRHASVLLLKSFDANAWPRRGTANNYELTVRAIAYIMAGHELHHRKALKEKYLVSAAHS
jgi:hypothetical protein